ncbi:RICIN domain-containing protein [Streptomyces sp.]|uniref:RICIN domain-containing protein n=1 Tax=Streptomyces sp. TaxID=1931 RepID=UPI002D38BDB5|nr:RICIN domain-containing protein [Streptomyces sp.]HZF87494.1 RICIN domain-containing protein [Streptomyces sp.]
MQPPYPPRPPCPPHPGSGPGLSDRDLVARLCGPGADPRALALLLARHWRAAHEYAAICLASPSSSAAMVTTAAFRQVLGDRAADGALRPRLLATVRETVAGWAADAELTALLPELGKPTGGRGLRATRSLTPERRRLAERAFHALPGAYRCLLWHTEVEAEPITVPAGLLGVDSLTAATALEQAREQFRANCVRAHRELAPTKECRFHNRLLDIPMRRGGALLPDVQRHLQECRYCRHAAEQLASFDGSLAPLLAETVLGWGARRYLESRPGRTAAPAAPGRTGTRARTRTGPTAVGRHRTAAPRGGRALLTPPRRPVAVLLLGVGVTSLALLATLLAATGHSGDNGVTPGPDATWGAPGSHTVRPSPAPSRPGAAPADHAGEAARGRLRNRLADRCLDTGGAPRAGVRAGLAHCSSAAQWSYREDGLLRSAADPALCLDAGDRTAVLADCATPAGRTGYDLTAHGELLPRRQPGRAVAAGPGTDVVVTGRDGSAGQRWEFEAADDGAPESRPKRGCDNASGRQPPPEPVARAVADLLPAAAPVGAAEAEPVVPTAPGSALLALAARAG